MKSFIFSLCLLAAAVSAALFLSLEIRSASSDMSSCATALPDECNDPVVLEMIKEIDDMWHEHRFLYIVSLSHTVFTNIELCISDLNCSAITNQSTDYLKAKMALYIALDSIITGQSLGFEGIF